MELFREVSKISSDCSSRSNASNKSVSRTITSGTTVSSSPDENTADSGSSYSTYSTEFSGTVYELPPLTKETDRQKPGIRSGSLLSKFVCK
ncbi:hypothetical protein KIN20_008180 [Parelaphostrongylus tenuis]|uniref:Uncharacterized protein n=1 Tax=Parelaphostrongylus tenuis TaxID=148309 RepID=A0AAD5M6G7_PARTN|nr:hypothetical protein KIN20_008180 [Parelaphostrongylus tenuis]